MPRSSQRTSATTLTAEVWSKPSFDDLPAPILEAAARRDWESLRDLLKTGIAPRGVYGRQVLWFRRELPLGVDPVLDQLRGDAALQFGAWDELDRVLRTGRTVDAAELEGIRDAVLAPIGSPHPPILAGLVVARAWEHALGFEIGRLRRVLREVIGWRPPFDARPDVSASRFIRYRRLQEAALMAHVEAIGGSLDAAIALGAEARELGEEGDVLRLIAADTEALARHARGGDDALELRYLPEIRDPRGPAPIDIGTILVKMLPLLVAARHPSMRDAASLAEEMAVGMGSPRLQLVARFWVTLTRHLAGERTVTAAEAAALRVETRTARPALRLLAELLDGLAGEHAESFAAAARFARRSGHVWAQVSALVWLMALSPTPLVGRRLGVLLHLTGWRRPVAVPEAIVGRAVQAFLGSGSRPTWLLELASASAPPTVAVQVATAYLRDRSLAVEDRLLAIDVLERLGAVQARADLQTAAREDGPVGQAAGRALAHPERVLGLSAREMEVVELAGQGLTDKEIADRLGLSPFTIARHLANARSKLGASNRSAAAVVLEHVRRGKAPD